MSQQDASLKKDEREELIEHLTRLGQNKTALRLFLPRIESVVVPEETIQGFFIQKKPFHNDMVAVTKRRIFIYRPKYFGGSWMEEFAWQFLSGARMEHNPIYSTVYIKHSERSGRPMTLKIDWLPRLQALELYRLAKEMDDYWWDENRVRDLQMARAKAGGWMGGMNLREIGKPAVPHWNDPKTQQKEGAPGQSAPPSELPALPSTVSGSPPQLVHATPSSLNEQALVSGQPHAPSLSDSSHPQLPVYQEFEQGESTFYGQSAPPFDLQAALAELKQLLDEQLITPEEYEEKKKVLLARL